jgi:hypothetical protein
MRGPARTTDLVQSGIGELGAKVRIAMAPDAIGRTIAFAVEPPSDVDASESIFRPTAEI